MPSPTALSTAAESDLVAAYTAHVPIRHLAKRYHLGTTRIHQILARAGVHNDSVPNFDAAHVAQGQQRAERNARMEALYLQGMTILDISKATDSTRDLVRDVLRKAGYMLPSAQGLHTGYAKCRCCGIILAESGDACHEAAETGGLCQDCDERYTWSAGTWIRRLVGHVCNVQR